MAYNMTPIEDATNIYEFYRAANTISNNLIVYLTLISMFVILLMILTRRNSIPESVLTSSLVCAVFSLLFASITLVSVVWVVGFTTLAGLAAIKLYLD